MKKELDKTYDPQGLESRLYQKWEDNKYFRGVVDKSKKPFSIVMPPPNITGQLHMGHAFDNTMQDILIRFKKMQGFATLWQPGTDHASIATEVKIIEKLKAQGIDKEDLGREKFLEKAWEWKEEYGGRIVQQLKKLGSAADWERERFTMDEGCSQAVTEVFIKLYEKDMIYKGNRIINWCPLCKTTISDAEVEHEEQTGHFWHIKYPIVDSSEFVEIATTRPETMLGDTGIAVHPEDKRYQHLIGKQVVLPLVNKKIPIIADYYVDKEFGTGVVKITPAHDPNDFEVGKRHNLPVVNVLNDDATINELGGRYEGMDRYLARKEIVADLDQLGLLVKVKDHIHNVGTHDRCHTTVEPMAKPQWFVKMDELAKPAREALENGDLRFVPEHFDKTYIHWLDGIRDWCISRQLWWGHRIPAYYCQECGEIIVAREEPDLCKVCGSTRFKQDEDTLDTWFSSALWPFSTLGWPNTTEELDFFYPTNVLVTGYDIIFFWVVRMVFSGYEYTGKAPFDTVLIHGLIRDAQGIKMSKSLGNGIDPLEVIEKYGADALRLTLMTGNSPGNDMRFNEDKVEASRNFANKVWNASRFIMMNLEDKQVIQPSTDQLNALDKAILSKANTLARDVTENMEKYELGIAVGKVYDFIWDEFCDWYIEMSKPCLWKKEENPEAANATLWTLKEVLTIGLKLLHPFMPFITEEIFCTLWEEKESIMIESWPIMREEYRFVQEEEWLESVKEGIRQIRNVRSGMEVPPSRKAKVILVTQKKEDSQAYEKLMGTYHMLAMANEIVIQEDKQGIGEDAVSVVTSHGIIYLPLEDLVDFEKEKERLEKEKLKLEKEVNRSEAMLKNDKFMSKAAPEKVTEEREKLEKYRLMFQQVEQRLAQMK